MNLDIYKAKIMLLTVVLKHSLVKHGLVAGGRRLQSQLSTWASLSSKPF